ncbi:hypothetical protein F5Y14DRAFT_448674 [Nemania sp. NC0429]|nr:hypothetical protein F5Y14DRAFT_448674 [Nemania sp. NC0429]
MSWARYAHGKDMIRFGDLEPPKNDKRPSTTKASKENPDNKKQDQENLHRASKLDGQHPSAKAKTTYTEPSGPAAATPLKKILSTFGNPSPQRHGARRALWIRSDTEVVEEATPYPERPLDDLYLLYPEKKLRATIEPSTVSLAASVVLQVVDESAYQWFKKWCPDMDLREVFESINGNRGKEGGLAKGQYKVPPEAIDTSNMATSLADMYRHCRGVFPKDSRDTDFPLLLKLIDRCVNFLSVLKDSERMTLLEATKSMLQWILIGLDAKRFPILQQARADLDALRLRYGCSSTNEEADYEILSQKQQAEELDILDISAAEFEIHRKTFEAQILDQLGVLLASTARSLPEEGSSKTN